MGLNDELNDKTDKEEKKNIIDEAGMEFTDEEMDGVAGGLYPYDGIKTCPNCSRELRYDRNYCSCGYSFYFGA